MALPLRSSQSSWRNRTYIHTQVNNNTGGLNKCQVNTTDNIESDSGVTKVYRGWEQGAGPGIKEVSIPGTGNNNESKAQGRSTLLVGPRNDDQFSVPTVEVLCRNDQENNSIFARKGRVLYMLHFEELAGLACGILSPQVKSGSMKINQRLKLFSQIFNFTDLPSFS